MPECLVITSGRVIDPSQNLDCIGDVIVEDGRITHIVPLRTPAKPSKASESAPDKITIDATGMIVCPGLIDMHVHLREPGNEDAETIASGAAAAVAGGFTSVACMPNTRPSIDTEAMIEFVYRQAARADLCNVFPVGAISKGRDGKELAELGQMVRAGAVAFSDDGAGVADSSLMYRSMQYARMFDRVLIQHCEDPLLAAGGCMNAGLTALRLGLPGIPAIAEELMIQRDILIARETRGRYHVAHISTAGAVELVRQGKSDGVAVTSEVCPHHLLMTDECCGTYDTNYKMNPPLRGPDDVAACIAAVRDGTIDCLVTDHAPHGRESKEVDFQSAPFGIVGLEVAVGLFAKALIQPGHLDWPQLIAKLTINPAKILGLDRGTLRNGAVADLTVIDPNRRWQVDPTAFRSKSRNSPYGGLELVGRVVHTIVRGRIKHTVPTKAQAA
jgi:dihydroorotase